MKRKILALVGLGFSLGSFILDCFKDKVDEEKQNLIIDEKINKKWEEQMKKKDEESDEKEES